jgi:signal peptidase I
MDAIAIRRIAEQLSCARENPARPLRLKVTGESMAPWLRRGDFALAQPVEMSRLRRGDLVVVQREDGFLTHRLVGRNGTGWITKGDRCWAPDPVAPDGAIVGRVIGVQRGGKPIDLQTLPWKAAQRLLGWLGWWETRVYTWLRSP